MFAPSPASDRPGQPALDDLITVLQAPATVLSDPDGQLRAHGAQGVYVGDTRLCSRLEIAVEDTELHPRGHHLDGVGGARFDAELRTGSSGPAVLVTRSRSVDAERMVEQIELRNPTTGAAALRLVLRARSDLAGAPVVKSGAHVESVTPRVRLDAVRWSGPADGAELAVAPAAGSAAIEGDDAVLGWPVHLKPGARWSVRFTVAKASHARLAGTIGRRRADDGNAAASPQRDGFGQGTPIRWTIPSAAVPERLVALLQRSLRDLDGLLLADPLAPEDTFAAAGSPWFCTLFGRDSLWSARLLLSLGTELAAGTLRTLARRQGRRDDDRSEEQPGKIIHEVRAGGLRAGGLDLPPHYYGTIDATALWCCLLHDAWRAGLADDQVAPLLPNLEAALGWIARGAGTGFLAYRGSTGAGLANQGWKDSPDGVRWADGTVAERPLALCEVQGYAYAAARGGAALLEAFGRPGAQGLRDWAQQLAERFRGAFWIDDPAGRYPAIAVDGRGHPVTGPASNMAHLLSTGLLSPTEADLVADRLSRPDLDSGAGLRTLSSTNAAFHPLSYHCGSVWPHDTAIAVLGLAGVGRHEVAHSLAEGFVAAAAAFDDRLPELYGVAAGVGGPLAYPTACRPQAWAAAGAVAVVGYLSGWPAPRS
ncbi:MAG: glycogen debranching N-terminal domain-containing protein [Pseudonocardia sp.]